MNFARQIGRLGTYYRPALDFLGRLETQDLSQSLPDAVVGAMSSYASGYARRKRTFRPATRRIGRPRFARPYARRSRPLPRRRYMGGMGSQPSNGLQGVYRTSAAFRRSRPNRPELKYFDVTGQFQSASATIQQPSGATSGWVLVGLAQGTGESQRVGRKITCRNLLIKGVANLEPGTGNDATDVGQFWVVLDTQANGAGAIATDVWDTVNLGGSQSFRQLDNDTRFKILKHCRFEFTGGAGAGPNLSNQVKLIEMAIPLQGLNITYASTLGAITEIKENNLMIFTSSLNGLVQFSWATRLRYMDV